MWLCRAVSLNPYRSWGKPKLVETVVLFNGYYYGSLNHSDELGEFSYFIYIYIYIYIYIPWLCSRSGPGPLPVRFLDHIQTHTHSEGFLWTSVQPVAETSTWRRTTLTTDRHLCLTHNPSKRTAADPRLWPPSTGISTSYKWQAEMTLVS